MTDAELMDVMSRDRSLYDTLHPRLHEFLELIFTDKSRKPMLPGHYSANALLQSIDNRNGEDYLPTYPFSVHEYYSLQARLVNCQIVDIDSGEFVFSHESVEDAKNYLNRIIQFITDHKDQIEKIKSDREAKRAAKTRLRWEQSKKEEIRQKILQREERKRLHKEVLEELDNESLLFRSGTRSREPIPQDVMDRVWNRDGGMCVKCGSMQNLEFDHIIPHSKGGANTYRNLQLLCEKCNRDKSNKIG